jgi:hypothetical protein
LAKFERVAELNMEAETLVQEIEAKPTHGMDKVLHVMSLAFQLGQLGEIWDGFFDMGEFEAIGQEVKQYVYPGVMEIFLGKRLIDALQSQMNPSDQLQFPVKSIKTIAAICGMMGDMDKRNTIEDK